MEFMKRFFCLICIIASPYINASSIIINDKYDKIFDDNPSQHEYVYILKEKQDKISKQIELEYRSGEFTFKNPYLKVDPYDCNPLSALLWFKTNEEKSVQVIIKGKHNDDITLSDKISKYHQFNLYGLYQDYDNKIIIKIGDQENQLNIRTKKVNASATVLSKIYQPSAITPPNYLYFQHPHLEQVYSQLEANDVYGNIRVAIHWKSQLIPNRNVMGIKQYNDGNFLIGSIKTDLFGRILKIYKRPRAINHDVLIMPNQKSVLMISGKYKIYLSEGDSYQKKLDIRELSSNEGEIISDYKRFCLARPTVKECLREDYFHMNSLSLDKRDNSLLVSTRSQFMVIKINLNTLKVKWIFGPSLEFMNGFNKYKLHAKFDDRNLYNYGQHQVTITKNGNILLFNNRDRIRELFPYWDFENIASGDEYYIDENNMTVDHIKSYGNHRRIAVKYAGGAQELPDGNRLIVFPNQAWRGENSSIYAVYKEDGSLIFETFVGDRRYRVMAYDIYKGLDIRH